MRRFGYCLDPLWFAGCAAYAVNRWVVKPSHPAGFFHGAFNDLWLVPCALPPILWLHRRLGWRAHDGPPEWSEIALHLVLWSVVCEGIAPRFLARATGDVWDVAAYAVGATLAGLWWRRPLRIRP